MEKTVINVGIANAAYAAALVSAVKVSYIGSGRIVGSDDGKSTKNQPRNSPCLCGSGLKAKRCCVVMPADGRAKKMDESKQDFNQKTVDRLENMAEVMKSGDLSGCRVTTLSKIEDELALPPEQMRDKLLRYHDLVRYMRSELHEAGLISIDEYAALLDDSCSVERLHGYDALRKQLAEAREKPIAVCTPWQPFETAPEDGTLILVYREDVGVFLAHYVDEGTISSEENGDKSWSSVDGEYLAWNLPSHWMPIFPPTEQERK